jgi:hypothetical protein
MADRFNSFIDELDKFVPAKNKHSVIESRASHIIASAVNLVQLIRESYDDDIAQDLIKRLHRSIISEDNRKFLRKIREIKTEN